MSIKGRKPKPTNIHLINGNPGKRPLHTNTGSDVPVEIPESPAHLTELALVEWNRITQELYRLGLIAKIDRANLGVYCMAYARWTEAEEKIIELGEKGLVQNSINGYQQMSVWLQISNRAVEQMRSVAADFGMNPSARVRVNPNPQLDLFGDGVGSAAPDNRGAKSKAPTSYFTQ